MSFKVIDVGTNRKPVCDFLLVINSNWHPISYTVSELSQLTIQISLQRGHFDSKFRVQGVASQTSFLGECLTTLSLTVFTQAVFQLTPQDPGVKREKPWGTERRRREDRGAEG